MSEGGEIRRVARDKAMETLVNYCEDVDLSGKPPLSLEKNNTVLF